MAKKPRDKKYVQKYSSTQLGPIFGFGDDELYKLKLVAHMQLTALAEGNGSPQAFGELLSRLVLGRELAIYYFTPEVAERIHFAVNKMVEAFYRGDDVQDKKYEITAEERAIIGDRLGIIDDLHAHLSRKEYHKIQQYCQATMTLDEILASDLPWELYVEWREDRAKKRLQAAKKPSRPK